MAVPETFPGAWSSGVDGTSRALVEPPESIGAPQDTPAVSIGAENSIFGLLKGCLVGLGVASGSGDADVVADARLFVDPLSTLGEMEDAAAPSLASASSAIALSKTVLARASGG